MKHAKLDCQAIGELRPPLATSVDGSREKALLFCALVGLGIAIRLALVLIADNRLSAPWSGSSDAPSYILLAHNLVAGMGYAYGGQPTAYRAPLYPIALATSMKLFGAHALEAIRLCQFAAGLLTVWICACISQEIFGKRARKGTLLIALFFPTLAVVTAEILTEASAALISVIFLYFLVRYYKKPTWSALIALSVTVGVATLARFNMALLEIVLTALIFFRRGNLSKWRSAALSILLPILILSPWLIRNFVVFHGSLVLSTETGPAALMGVLTPQGRGLPGDWKKLQDALGVEVPGWVSNKDRASTIDETELNRRAWRVAVKLWRQKRWKLVPLALLKLSYFWLGTDQIFWTGGFRSIVRVGRAAGTFIYWLFLALAIAGWLRLRVSAPTLAKIFLFYAALVTLLHVPFTMSTRLRIPFIDSLLAVLAGAESTALCERAAHAAPHWESKAISSDGS